MTKTRMLRELKRFAGSKITIDSQEHLFFGGTAYLGLLEHPEYIENFKKGIDQFGLNNGTSRSNNVQLGIYQQAEEWLAERFSFASAALLSSGFLAGQVAVNALAEKRRTYVAPDAHPALWLFGRSGKKCSQQDWLEKTVQDINQQQEGEFLICVNSLNNLIPEPYDFTALDLLLPERQVTLLIDDSHGLGVVNKNEVSFSRGSLSSSFVDLVVIASLAKGLGTDAGIVMARAGLIDEIKSHPIFLGSSPPAPAGIYALVNGAAVYERAFDKLQQNISLFEEITRNIRLKSSERFPVFTSSDNGLAEFLLRRDIVVSSFPYPLPDSAKLNRIVLSSSHSPNDLRHLGATLSRRDGLKL